MQRAVGKAGILLCGVVGAGLLAAGSAQAAVGGDRVKLVGTTVPGKPAPTRGRIDATAESTLVFRAEGGAGKPGVPELAMPYGSVFEFGIKHEDAFHLGFFPAMFYGMVAPRPKRHVFTVSWHDADDIAQEATFEVPGKLSEHLMHVLYARARKACVRSEYGACAPVVAPPPAPRVPLTAPATP